MELDPATGEEDQLLSARSGTWADAKRLMSEILTEFAEDWDEGWSELWPWLMIRPVE